MSMISERKIKTVRTWNRGAWHLWGPLGMYLLHISYSTDLAQVNYIPVHTTSVFSFSNKRILAAITSAFLHMSIVFNKFKEETICIFKSFIVSSVWESSFLTVLSCAPSTSQFNRSNTSAFLSYKEICNRVEVHHAWFQELFHVSAHRMYAKYFIFSSSTLTVFALAVLDSYII